jgi:hypothetical protein
MEEIDSLDPNELIRNMRVCGEDENGKKLPFSLKDWDRTEEEFEERRKIYTQILEEYENRRFGSDDDNTIPIIPDVPKPPLNLGGYKRLEDEEN